MRRLEDKEQFDLYVTYWEKLKEELFKLETLQVYEETPGLKEYQQGDIDTARKLMREFLLSDPTSPYEKIKKRGIKFRRVHIVELPLNPYLYFEIESYKISAQLGEEIFFVLKEDVDKIEKPIEPQDLLIFDNEKVMLHYYDEAGNWQYGALVEEPEEVKKYVKLKDQLIDIAIPMEKFLNKYKI
jgi:hypothetical protein